MTPTTARRSLRIEARGLTKRYGTTVAVDDLTFDVLPGQVTGFLGPNGAGKSTTLRMILGLDTPSAGTVTIGGTPYRRHRRPLHEVGALLDARALHTGRSAYNNLLCIAQSNGIGRSRVQEVIDLVGLTGVAKKRAGEFSLGMSQRLGIAIALLGDPDILLFDEPVNGLDTEGIVWIRNLMRDLAAGGRTVLVSSHLMSEMALTADHVIVLGRGRLIAATSIEDFVARSSKHYVRVRTDRLDELTSLLGAAHAVERDPDGALHVHGLSAAVVGDLAASRGIALHELTEIASLEDAFIELTHDHVDFAAAPVLPAQANGVAHQDLAPQERAS